MANVILYTDEGIAGGTFEITPGTDLSGFTDAFKDGKQYSTKRTIPQADGSTTEISRTYNLAVFGSYSITSNIPASTTPNTVPNIPGLIPKDPNDSSDPLAGIDWGSGK